VFNDKLQGNIAAHIRCSGLMLCSYADLFWLQHQ